MKAALINETTNEVVNIIELDVEAKWQAPIGHFVRFSEDAHIGMFWDGEIFTTENPANL